MTSDGSRPMMVRNGNAKVEEGLIGAPLPGIGFVTGPGPKSTRARAVG
jgi:hypothetical protein